MASPETDQIAAYALGQAAWIGGQVRESNPYGSGSPLLLAQQASWNKGFDETLVAGCQRAFFSQIPPPEDWARRDRFSRVIPAAQIKTAFSAPVILVPGIPNAMLFIRYARYKKAAGVAYVANGNTNLIVNYFLGSVAIRNLTIATYFAQTLATKFIERQGTTFGAGNTEQYVGAPIRLALDTADMVTGDGDLTVDMDYEWIYL